MSRCCRFVSDLHRFSRRSEGDRYESAIQQAAKETDVLALGGDIFDFKWSTLASQKETIREACLWLMDLASLNRRCEVHYVLGNHDFNDPFMEALDNLADDCPNFHWHCYYLQLGKTLFLHGDVADRFMDQDELVLRRQSWKKHGRPPAMYHDFYSLAINLGLHKLPAFFFIEVGKWRNDWSITSIVTLSWTEIRFRRSTSVTLMWQWKATNSRG